MKRRERIARVEAVIDEAKRVIVADVDGRVALGMLAPSTVQVMRLHLAQLDIALGRVEEPPGWAFALATKEPDRRRRARLEREQRVRLAVEDVQGTFDSVDQLVADLAHRVRALLADPERPC